MVFYFTATGNSLYVAKQLDQNLVSIPQAIHAEDLHFQDEAIGIVCPVFGHEVPPMVKEFMRKADFQTDFLLYDPYLWQSSWWSGRAGRSPL